MRIENTRKKEKDFDTAEERDTSILIDRLIDLNCFIIICNAKKEKPKTKNDFRWHHAIHSHSYHKQANTFSSSCSSTSSPPGIEMSPNSVTSQPSNLAHACTAHTDNIRFPLTCERSCYLAAFQSLVTTIIPISVRQNNLLLLYVCVSVRCISANRSTTVPKPNTLWMHVYHRLSGRYAHASSLNKKAKSIPCAINETMKTESNCIRIKCEVLSVWRPQKRMTSSLRFYSSSCHCWAQFISCYWCCFTFHISIIFDVVRTEMMLHSVLRNDMTSKGVTNGNTHSIRLRWNGPTAA